MYRYCRYALLTFACTLIPRAVTAQAAGDFRSAQAGTWAAAATWERFDGTNWQPALAPPVVADGVVTIRAPHVVQVAGSTTADQVQVDLAATLRVNSGQTLTVADGSGVDLVVNGRVDNTGVIVSDTGAGILFAAGGEYRHLHATAPGAIPTATWDAQSFCSIVAYTTNQLAPAGLSQVFGNFRWSCASQNFAIPLGGALTAVAGDFEMLASGNFGRIILASSGTCALDVGGDFKVQAGRVTLSTGTGVADVTIHGDFLQSNVGQLTPNTTTLADVFRVHGNFSYTGGSLGPGANLRFEGAVPHTIQCFNPFFGTVRIPAGGELTCVGSVEVGQMEVGGTLHSGGGSWIADGLSVLSTGQVLLDPGTMHVTFGSCTVAAGGDVHVGMSTLTVDTNLFLNGHMDVTTGQVRVGRGTFGSGSVFELNEGFVDVANELTISAAAILDCGTGVVRSNPGVGFFSLHSLGILRTESPAGISAAGPSGSIQVDHRIFSPGAFYWYTGAGNQATGSGLPSTVAGLQVRDGGGSVTLSSDLTVSGAIVLQDGALDFGGRVLRVGGMLLVEVEGALRNTSGGELHLGAGLQNDGAVMLDGSVAGCGGPDNILVRSTVPGEARTWSGAGSVTVVDVDLAELTAAAGPVWAPSCTDAGNNLGWNFVPCTSDVAQGGSGFSLGGVFPQPLMGNGRVEFDLPRAMAVQAEVFDVAGRRVGILWSGNGHAGANAIPLSGRALPAGYYVLRLTSAAGVRTKPVVVLK